MDEDDDVLVGSRVAVDIESLRGTATEELARLAKAFLEELNALTTVQEKRENELMEMLRSINARQRVLRTQRAAIVEELIRRAEEAPKKAG